MERRALKNTFDIRLVNHKVIAIILAVAMILSVFAGIIGVPYSKADEKTNVYNETEMESIIDSYHNVANEFDFLEFVGSHYSNGKRRQIINNRLNEAPMAEEYVNSVYNNMSFKIARTIWGAADWVSNPFEEAGEAIEESQWGTPAYYEAIIMRMLTDTVESSLFISIVNSKDIQNVKKIKKYLGEALDQYNYKYMLDRNVLIEQLSDDEKAKAVEAAERFVRQEHENMLGEEELSALTKHLYAIISTSKSFDEFYKKTSTYMSLQSVNAFMIDYLKSMRERSNAQVQKLMPAEVVYDELFIVGPTGILLRKGIEGNHKEFIKYYAITKAIDDVISMYQKSELGWLWQYASDKAIQTGRAWLTKYLQKELKNSIIEASANGLFNMAASSIALNTAQITIALTKTIGNMFFSTDSILDKLETTKCLVDLEYLSADCLNEAFNKYDKSLYSTFFLLNGLEFHYNLLNYDRELMIDVLDLSNTKVQEWLRELLKTQDDYDNAKHTFENQIIELNTEYDRLSLPIGDCSDTTTWAVTTNNELIFFGYGDMGGYNPKEAPWLKYNDEINSVFVGSSIDSVGANSFNGLTKINKNIVFDKELAFNSGCFDNLPNNTIVFAETPHFYGNHEIKSNIYSSEDISDDDYGNVYLSGNVFIRKNVSFISYWRSIVIRDGGHFSCQDMEDKGGTFSVQPGGYAEVRGDLTGGPAIKVNGTMVLKGNCLKFNNFSLESTSSYLQVFGDLGSPSQEVASAAITNGVIELFGSVYGSYNAGGNSTTIIKGTEKQRFGSFSAANLRIENTSPEGLEFNNWATAEKTLSSSTPKMKNGRLLRLKGEIVGEEYYGDFRLDNGATIDHNLTVYGSVYGFPNGYSTGNVCEPGVTLYVKGDFDLTANGTYGGNDSTLIIPSGATVNVDGNTALSGNYYPNSNWMVQRVTLQIDGTLNVEGDFTTGTNGFASLKMENENAQLNVKGDYTGYREVQKNRVAAGEPSQIVADITAGTINIDGNVDKMLAKGNSTITVRGADISNSAFSERNVVRLSGSKEQALSGNELFATLILQHNNGLIFSTKTQVGNLFNHNGYAFTVSDQENTVFVDYDGDGQLDNDDPFPTDPNNVRHYEETAHAFVLLESVEPTCTVDGYKKFKCSECGTIKTERVPKLGHSFAWADNIHIAPSCTEEGYTVETCSRCGETQRSNILPATGHDFGDMISYDHVSNIYDENKRFVDSLAYTPNTVTANTIGSTAIGSSELLRAGWAVAPREIRLDSDKLGAIEEYAVTLTRHPLSLTGVANVSSVFAYDDTTQRSPEESALPYTDSEGNLYSIDSGVLSLAMNREQAEQKGILNPDGTVNVLAAEAENLKLAYSAGIPGTYILLPNIEFQNALTGWNEPVSIFHYDGKGAAEPGVRHVNYCFYNETLSGTLETTIKLYDYSKQNQLVPSTSDMPSYIKHTCVDCGSVVKEDIQSDQKLKIKAVSLSLGNNLSMNFKVDKTILDDYSDLCIEIMRNGKVTKVSSYKVQGDDIVFSFDGIAPQTMNDNTSAVLYGATPSKLYRGESVSTSVKEYASKALELYNDNKYAKLRTLMVDLLNYGSTAQIYHNYQKASLANADLTEEQQAWASIQPLELENITNTEYQTVSNPIANWKSASLILDNAVAIRYKFECEDVSGMVVKVQYGDIEKVFDGTSFEESGTGEYSFKFSGLYAHQMRLPIYVTLYKDDKPVSNTLQYSVESYAAQVAEIMPKSSLNTLTDSMMRYGISAFEYGN